MSSMRTNSTGSGEIAPGEFVEINVWIEQAEALTVTQAMAPESEVHGLPELDEVNVWIENAETQQPYPPISSPARTSLDEPGGTNVWIE